MEVEELQLRRLKTLHRKLSTGLDDQIQDDEDDKDDKSDKSQSRPRDSSRRAAAVERARARDREFQHARSKSAARGSGARGSNEAAGVKRKVKEFEGPMSPGAIRKAARTYWDDLPSRMVWHTAVGFPKFF